MSATSAPAGTFPVVAPEPSPPPVQQPPTQVETSLIPRFVALFTPVFVVAAGWLAGAVARYFPGLHLDTNQMVVFMTAAAVAALTAAWKWLHGWQQHEQLVAEGRSRPIAIQRKVRKKARANPSAPPEVGPPAPAAV